MATKTVFNVTARSSARCYANCELPLGRVKAVARATGCTVNDVCMAVVDHALHRYLAAEGQAMDEPLSVLMPLSFRGEGEGGGANQVSMDVVTLGAPAADLVERLAQIHQNSHAVKARTRQMPIALRQLYTVFIAGRATLLPDLSPLFNEVPVANLLISNMAGPQEQLYLGGARLAAFHGLPIVPPGVGLNVTFSSVNEDICLGVGALPEAMSNPFHLTEMIKQVFTELDNRVVDQAAAPRQRKTIPQKLSSSEKGARRKTTSGKKSPARNSTAGRGRTGRK